MALKKPNWSNWREKLKNVYRFQIVDEKSYDVKMVLELNRLYAAETVYSGLWIFIRQKRSSEDEYESRRTGRKNQSTTRIH